MLLQKISILLMEETKQNVFSRVKITIIKIDLQEILEILNSRQEPVDSKTAA